MAKKQSAKSESPIEAKDWWLTPKGRLQRLRDVLPKDIEADRENRNNFIADMKFIHEPGAQWDDYTRVKRSSGDKEIRPMYQDNRLRVTIKRIVNNMRANPAAGKVRPFEDGDKELADIREGLIRAIANQSNFESILDDASEYQVAGGYAAWGIEADYSDDTGVDQDLKIRQLRNPLCLHCDRFAYDLIGRDAGHWSLIDHISKEAYETRYPNKEVMSFDSDDNDNDWMDNEKVRIAEFWYRVPVKKTIYLLSDGKTIAADELDEAKGRGLTVLKSRDVDSYDIYSAIYSGEAELSKPTRWLGRFFPWVRIYGEYMVLDGQTRWYGAVRHAKDAQRGFNLMMTSAVEAVASQPVNQVWATAKQAEGLAQNWADAANKNLPFQLYNTDPSSPGPPQRVGAPEVPIAMMQLAQFMGESIKADTGIFDSSLGQQGNETSGRAINARQQQGEIATFNYPANRANGIKRTWEILNDAMPYYYDTPRSLRILGADDSDKFVRINDPDPVTRETLNDLSQGKFDIVMTVGPSFATKRQEAVEAYSQMAQSNPDLMQIAGDLIMKGMDLPYADEVAERIKLMLPPPIQQAINKDKKMPPEVQQAMMQVDQAMQQVQQKGQLVQQAAQEAQGEKADAEKAKADVQVAIANLKTQEAQFETKKAQFETLVANAKTELSGREQQVQAQAQQGEEAITGGEQAQAGALAEIQQAAAEFKQEAQQFLSHAAQIIAIATQTPLVIEKSGARTVRVKRVNGELVGQVIETDGPAKEIRVTRDDAGELIGTIQ